MSFGLMNGVIGGIMLGMAPKPGPGGSGSGLKKGTGIIDG